MQARSEASFFYIKVSVTLTVNSSYIVLLTWKEVIDVIMQPKNNRDRTFAYGKQSLTMQQGYFIQLKIVEKETRATKICIPTRDLKSASYENLPLAITELYRK